MTHGEQECDNYEEVLKVPMYYYIDKDGDKVYDTDLMFQHFEELMEELTDDRTTTNR